jgi:tRNA A-37 threonylcarbamoyl transferase component Bud32
MALPKTNCWEYKKCGREPGGEKADELGLCPAAVDTSFSGINSGKCGGRFCWAVAGTFCGDKIQGTFAEKRDSCLTCDFFNRVQAEEGTANLRTKFLRFVFSNVKSPLLVGMNYKHIKQGQRFIIQGEIGDTAYIIQRGSCLVIVEKDGQLHPVDHRVVGDIVGMMSILSGEDRNAHVEAETEMEVWCLEKCQFEDISQKDPELLEFMTEVVADRFDSGRPTADRSIGKYIATDIIGRGGYSIVYKGVHAELNMPVAIKMMRHDLAMDSEFLENFRNEAKIIDGFDHENIIKVYDMEECFKTVFIIMEYLEGKSINEMLLLQRVIPPPLAGYFIVQICSAMQYAHRQGITHRDINPTNIIVKKDDRLKLLDFGLACPIGTDDMHMGGALPYLAPELLDGEPANQQSDIYALGITAYEMVTGARPYPEDSASALMKLRHTQDIPDPAAKVPDLPEPLRRFILKACRRDPAERYQNMGEALEELQPMTLTIPLRYQNQKTAEQKKTTFFLNYQDEHQEELNRLLKEFSAKVHALGANLKTNDPWDV